MIGPGETVGFARAAAEIPCHPVPSATIECLNQPADVIATRIAFETMGDDQSPSEFLVRRNRRDGRCRSPIKVEKIAIRELQPFAPLGLPGNAAGQGRPEGLGMPIWQPPRRSKGGGGDQRHNGISSSRLPSATEFPQANGGIGGSTFTQVPSRNPMAPRFEPGFATSLLLGPATRCATLIELWLWLQVFRPRFLRPLPPSSTSARTRSSSSWPNSTGGRSPR